MPLASGMLTGELNSNTNFGKDDHRNFNRNGEMFDKGETFAGIDYNKGLKITDKLRSFFPKFELPAFALNWILLFDEVSCVIQGALNPEQIIANIAASGKADLSQEQMAIIVRLYQEEVKPLIHQLW